MHTPITDESKFWQLAPGAEEIFRYAKENPEISQSPWGFDRGNMSDDLSKVWASFSCTSVSGWGKDSMTVTASKQDDGSWCLSHQVARAA
jgi:hypothetical protein